MRKRFFSIFAFLAVFSSALAASLLSSPALSLEEPYVISDDVSMLAVGSGSPSYRYNPSTNTWQYNAFGSWVNLTSATDLSTMLNAYGIATLEDVTASSITVPDLVSSYSQYFGSYPYQYTRRVRNATSATSTSSLSSLTSLIATIGSDLQSDLVGVSGDSFLAADGTSSTQPGLLSVYSVMRSGFLGLSSNLGQFPFSYYRTAAGASQNSTLSTANNLSSLISIIGQDIQHDLTRAVGSNYLSSAGSVGQSEGVIPVVNVLSAGLMGLGNQLMDNQSSKPMLYYLNGNSGISSSSFSSIGNILSTLGQSLTFNQVTNSSFLSSSGQLIDGSYRNSAYITAQGLQALYSSLRGSYTNFAPITFLDYTDLSSMSPLESSNLMSLNAAGFESIQNLLATYLYSHGTNLDIEIRHGMEEQAEQFVQDFTQPDGKGTPSASDISDMANISGSISDSFKSSSTPADAFNQLSSSDNWLFFSQSVADELNPFQASRGLSRQVDVGDGYIDALQPQLDSIAGMVGNSW